MGNKKQWGVLGKRQTFLSPSDIIKGKEKVPLNQNPFDPWDTKKSRYRRIVGQYPNDEQQSGVVEQPTTGVPSVTPSPTPSLTPSVTQTMTPSITPSSTPYPLPLTPNLWLDASDSSTITLINSGGTDYVSTWTSKGTSTWSLSGTNTDRMPIYSASTLMPGNPNCVRFTTNATSTLQDGLMAFDRTPISYTGGTLFIVVAKPSGSTYIGQSFTFNMDLYSGFTNGGFVGFSPTALSRLRLQGGISNGASFQQSISGYNLTNSVTVLSAASLNDKFLIRNSFSNAQNQYQVMEINQSASTSSLFWTASTANNLINSITIGLQTASAGTQTYTNQNSEWCEMMWFNTTLSNTQIEQIELYLKDKWRYDEWASPVPTATPTASPTQTTTNTPTPTPSATPPFNPLTLNPMIWVDFNDASTLSLRSGQYVQSVSNKGNWTAFTGFSQTTAADQPSWSASTMGTGMSAITISNNFLNAPQVLTGSAWNTFVVLKFSGTNEFQPIKISGTIGGQNSAWSNVYAQPGSNRYANFFIQFASNYRAGFSDYTSYSTPHIVQSYMSNSSTTIVDYMTINNSAQTETNIANSVISTGAPGTISGIFRIINEDGIYNDIGGEIGEMYFFDKELTSTQQSGLINYLKTKWGIS